MHALYGSDEEEIDDDIFRSMYPEYADTAMEDNEEEEAEERSPDEPLDDLGRVISDAGRGCDTDKERLQLSRCYGTTPYCCTQTVKMGRRSWVAHCNR